MKKILLSYCSAAYIGAYVCAMSALYTVFSMVEKIGNVNPGLAVWLPSVILCQLGLGFFLRRERSIRAVICFCAAFFLLQLIVVFLIYGFFSSLVGIMIAIAMWLYSYYCCYDVSVNEPDAEKLTKSFDLCSFCLMFVLFFCSIRGLPMKTAIPLAVMTGLNLFALIAIRGGEQRKIKSIFISGGIVLLFAAVAAVFIALASGGIKKLLELVLGAAYSLARFVLRAIDTVFRFIAGLFPEPDVELEMPPAEPGLSLGGAGDMSFELIDPQIIIAAMIGLGLIVALALVIYRLVKGKTPVIRIGGATEKDLSRSRSGFFAALKKALSRLAAKLSFALSVILQHNTAPGLLLQIERRSRSQLHGKAASESCREFLRRATSVYPHAEAELEALADALDRLHFGGGQGLGPAEIARMRRVIFDGKKE